MTRCAGERLGNPSSGHNWGRRARRRLEEARSVVAEALDATGYHVFFTRGGTESDNLALLGTVRQAQAAGNSTPLVVTSAIEHPAVFGAAQQAVQEGAQHLTLGFAGGNFDLDRLDEALVDGAMLVSCMWVNNEVGAVMPMTQVAELCRRHGVPLHSDAVQAVGKVRVNLNELPVDLLTVTGHKVYGPVGTGALLVQEPDSLLPLHFGGQQERGLRPGTEDVMGAVGFAEALRLTVEEQPQEAVRLAALRDAVEERLMERVDGLGRYPEQIPRAPHILALGVTEADSDTLLAVLDGAGVAASGGSACASGSAKPSRTFLALADDTEAAKMAALRLSFGRLNQMEDIGQIVDVVGSAIERTRALSR